MKNFQVERPIFPEKAVITAGMPYGNKELHFGHIGGVFIQADVFARFLRDRIGEENVIFVSGTDCYGATIEASYLKLLEEGSFKGTLEEYVQYNHERQRQVLEKYKVGLNLYGASALGRPSEIHKEVSWHIFKSLYQGGYLEKLSSPQFYDEEFKVFLNGRQVVGKCPIDGCNSDKAYADECALGHQYMPSELIDPTSILSGKKPKLVEVENWYFKLEDYKEKLINMVNSLKKDRSWNKNVLKTMEEFLKPPVIYIKRKELEKKEDIETAMPIESKLDDSSKASITYVFKTLEDRDKARKLLDEAGIRFRTGKTLVPFRLSGNVKWGIELPKEAEKEGLTFWVWPESLWAPISFTKAVLEKRGKSQEEWIDWWQGKNSKVYQFIGEDNIYFYGIAEMALFLALFKGKEGTLRLPNLIANKHLLFMDKKASSSAKIKPPMAGELLNYYTEEQLRMHFLSLGLSKKSVSFTPQALMKEEEKNGMDTVLKDGNLLTNVFNRIVRSCLYTAQGEFEGKIPVGKVSEDMLEKSKEAILTFERHMYNHEFHNVIYVLDTYIRNMNKSWVNKMKLAKSENNEELKKQILVDSFHGVRTTLTLIHSIVPEGSEKVREYLNINGKIWDWKYIFDPIYIFMEDEKEHKLKYLEPKTDFFEKHLSQIL